MFNLTNLTSKEASLQRHIYMCVYIYNQSVGRLPNKRLYHNKSGGVNLQKEMPHVSAKILGDLVLPAV